MTATATRPAAHDALPSPAPVEPEAGAAPEAAGDAAAPDVPRRIAKFGRAAQKELAIAVVAGGCLAGALCLLLDWRNPVTFALLALVGISVVQYVLVRDRLGSVAATDRLVTTLVWASGLVAVGVLVWMFVFLLFKGIPGLTADFFTHDMAQVGPLDPGGGVLHAIVGTLEQVAICALVTIPIAILTAVYLHEIKGRMAPVIRFVSDALSGLPSIVAGLLIFTLWVPTFGYSGFAASLALTIIMLPIVIRTAEEMLRTVPGSLREASLALGAPRWRTVTRVVLPAARSGLVTAAILGLARVTGETAPVLLTAFGSARMNANPVEGQQADLPLFVWSLLRQPNDAQVLRAWAGALVLVFLVLELFVVARAVGEGGSKRRQERR